MALSQQQKKFLNDLTIEPSIYYSLKDKTNFLNSFKEQYLQDGTGLLQILVIGYLHNKPYSKMYGDILLDVLDNSSLSITDKKTNTDSVYDLLLSSSKIYFDPLFCDSVYHNGNKTSVYIYFNALSYLLEHNKIDELDKFLLLDINIHDNYFPSTYFIQNLILANDAQVLDKIFKRFPVIKDKISYIPFNNSKNVHESSNFLTFSIRENSFNITEYFFTHLDRNYFLLNGQIKQNSSSIYSSNPNIKMNQVKSYVSPLWEAIQKNNFKLAKRIISYIDNQDELFQILFKQENSYRENCFQKLIVESSIREQLLPFIKELKNSSNQTLKLSCLKNILESKLDLPEQCFLLTQLFPDNYNSQQLSGVFNYFLFVLNDHKFEEINLYQDDIINIFQLFKNQFQEELDNYEQHFFNKPNLLKNNILIQELGKINFFSYKSNLLYNVLQQKDLVNKIEKSSDDYLDSLNYLFKQQEEINYSELLYLSIKNESSSFLRTIIKQLEPKEFNKYFQSNNQITQALRYCPQNFLNTIILIFQTISFPWNYETEHFKPIYLLLRENFLPILEQVRVSYNISFKELSQCSYFWENIKDYKTICYVKEHGAIFDDIQISEDLLLNSYALNNKHIKFYFEAGGTKPNSNIIFTLHNLSLYNNNQTLIEYFPEFSSITNEQKKYLASYLLTDLNHKCKKENKSNYPNSIGTVLEDSPIYKTLLLCIQHCDFKNKVATRFLKSQFTKYEIIQDKLPNLVKEFDACLLNRTLIQKEKPSKKMKI